MAEELWREVLREADSVHRQPWPDFDVSALVAEFVELPVQVNGKVRDRLTIAVGASEADVTAAALALPKVAAHLHDKSVRKVVVVPGKLVSVVAS
jgi:leucyl-tRNA synthetase